MNPADDQVFLIGCGTDRSAAGPVEAMGFKAYNLARAARLGIAVPAAFVLGARHCREFLAGGQALSDDLRARTQACVRRLEQASGLALGSIRRPLLLSVRSGAAVSMPGMMDTVLNVGLNESTLGGLVRLTGNPRLAWDSYRRLIQGYAEVVHGAPAAAFADAASEELHECGEDGLEGADFRAVRSVARRFAEVYAEVVGQPFPQSPIEQLDAAISAVFRSWDSARAVAYRRANGISDALGTAVTVQRMVFGNAGGNSGSGVAFTRDPGTGEDRLYFDFSFDAQGEDVVSGRTALQHGADLSRRLPGVYAELVDLKGRLEREFGDAQEFEFTVQDGQLYLLQTRAAKRTAIAALRIAVEQLESGLLSPAQARVNLKGIDLRGIEIVRVAGTGGVAPVAQGVAASAGVASGRIALQSDRVEMLRRGRQPVLLLREDISTSDIAAIQAADGILTTRGGRTSHAAVVARQLGKACIVGCRDLRIASGTRSCALGPHVLREGDRLCLDANTGAVYLGDPLVTRERPTDLLDRLAHRLHQS